MPFLFLLYLTSYLDRINVSYAGLEMTRDLGFNNAVFGFGQGIFFLGYLLLEIPGARFVSLQKALRRGDEEILARFPNIDVDRIRACADFADTAALVADLDLIIAVDTSLAHLAGALARPVWVLLKFSAHWAWLRDREDSPWYPTARLVSPAAPRRLAERGRRGAGSARQPAGRFLRAGASARGRRRHFPDLRVRIALRVNLPLKNAGDSVQ